MKAIIVNQTQVSINIKNHLVEVFQPQNNQYNISAE